MIAAGRRLAVVLFNLGGPDGPQAVRPFLHNLFSDPAIIRLAWPLRLLVASAISRRRARQARAIYAQLGGGSPILANTRAQADALETALGRMGMNAKVFIAMRYWHPMSDETAPAVKAWAPDEIILLPLYPQYSTTTTASSVGAWDRAAERAGLAAPVRTVCCYPADEGYVQAYAAAVATALAEASPHGRPRILFSAHGLPKSVVAAGDPYQWQCERTAEAIAARLADAAGDWVTCYQSRVGPLAWIGPSTESEIRRAGADGVPVVVAPIAFVSEHSETLVEIEIDYRELAHRCGVPRFVRVPTPGAAPDFIEGLARLVARAAGRPGAIASACGGRLCPREWSECPVAAARA